MILLKPNCSIHHHLLLIHLHFTMILLKLRIVEHIIHISNIFTFHYDSIKTPLSLITVAIFTRFTFHYDSIKTLLQFLLQNLQLLFTFHYDSIKTRLHSSAY